MTALRTAMCVAGGLLLAAPAVAQQAATEPAGQSAAALVRAMQAAPCEADAAILRMREILAATPATAEIKDEALRQVATGDDVCAGVKEAALVVALGMADSASALDPAPANPSGSVAAIVSEAYAEADRRAAQLSFEVGPPPRNITRGRVSGS